MQNQISPFVIYIQDAHNVTDAQNNIQHLIHYFQKTYGIDLIAIEGTEGVLDPTLFRAFPDEFVKKKVMQDYLNRGELGGPEMAAMFNEQQATYVGIEDWELYEANYRAYLQAIEAQPQLLEQLAQVREKLDQERIRIYTKELNEFHERVWSFYEEEISLMDLLGYLNTIGTWYPENTVASVSTGYQVPLEERSYPELFTLLDSLKGVGSFDASSGLAQDDARGSLETQIRQMAKQFKQKHLFKLSLEKRMEFNTAWQAFSTGQTEPGLFLKNDGRGRQNRRAEPKTFTRDAAAHGTYPNPFKPLKERSCLMS